MACQFGPGPRCKSTQKKCFFFWGWLKRLDLFVDFRRAKNGSFTTTKNVQLPKHRVRGKCCSRQNLRRKGWNVFSFLCSLSWVFFVIARWCCQLFRMFVFLCHGIIDWFLCFARIEYLIFFGGGKRCWNQPGWRLLVLFRHHCSGRARDNEQYTYTNVESFFSPSLH